MNDNRILTVNGVGDIPPGYRNTPIQLLVEYQTLNRPHDVYSSAQILVGMCMDNRKALNTPENFAYVLRSGGANMRYSGFKISYAIAVGGVRHIVIAGHNQCGMVKLNDRRELFVDGLVSRAGWDRERAERHFESLVPMFEIGDAVDFVLSEVSRLRQEYPRIVVAPMLYCIEDNKLQFIRE